MLLKVLSRFARELNWSRRKWSSTSDRAFHEDLYRADDYDPFSLEYPGYTTIRRFADLVAPHLPDRGAVLDFGCGPGEITCELASRRPDLSFVGIDHSDAAITKATANVARRQLANIRFERRDVEQYEPAEAVELATLFDSFHHLIKPEAFVRRLAPLVKRWALIEPRGSWAGTWLKELDFDWLAHDLDKIRAHVESLCHERSLGSSGVAGSTTAKNASAPTAAAGSSDEAVERRYTLDDLERFFDGHALDLRGTVAGLETYPPGSRLSGGFRDRFGELRYQLYSEIDDWLFARNLDLHAKHWLIVAERGGKSRAADVTRIKPPIDRAGGVHTAGPYDIAGPYDVRYGEYRGPRDGSPGERIVGAVTLTNEGWETWSSQRDGGVFTSYHWLDAQGHIIEFDGERTPLPRPLLPGTTSEVSINIVSPDVPARYQLAIDLVREGVTWFSQAGRPWLEVPFQVGPR